MLDHGSWKSQIMNEWMKLHPELNWRANPWSCVIRWSYGLSLPSWNWLLTTQPAAFNVSEIKDIIRVEMESKRPSWGEPGGVKQEAQGWKICCYFIVPYLSVHGCGHLAYLLKNSPIWNKEFWFTNGPGQYINMTSQSGEQQYYSQK